MKCQEKSILCLFFWLVVFVFFDHFDICIFNFKSRNYSNLLKSNASNVAGFLDFCCGYMDCLWWMRLTFEPNLDLYAHGINGIGRN